MTPAPKQFGKPCFTIATAWGSRPIATRRRRIKHRHRTARRPDAGRPARRANPTIGGEIDHPPRHAAVREEVAGGMKNRIAMISNFSMPVKSLSATDSIPGPGS